MKAIRFVAFVLMMQANTYAITPMRESFVPKEWVSKRVSESRVRLLATKPGRLIWKSIEVQGGLHRWFSNGPIFFRFRYMPLSGGKERDTFQTVDTWSARAVHSLASNQAIHFGWDGKVAWASPPEAKLPLNPRFWALTPYYFVAIPFVLADPGAHLEYVGKVKVMGKPYETVKVTYEAGTGDSPDDFYVIYLDPSSFRVSAVRYVVTYKGFFPEGGSSPEKFMAYEGTQRIDGIFLPKRFKTYAWNNGVAGSLTTRAELSDVRFVPNASESDFEVPTGAKRLAGY